MATYKNPKTGEVLTEEQFKSRYKQLPTAQPPQDVKQDLGQKTADIYRQSAGKIQESIGRAATKVSAADVPGNGLGSIKENVQKTGALLEGALGTAAGGARAVFAPVEATVGSAAELTGIDKLFGMLGQTKEAQAIAEWAENNPDAARNLSDALTVGGAVLSTAGGPKNPLNTPLENVPKTVGQAARSLPSDLQMLGRGKPTSIPQNIQFARQLTTPRLTTKEAEEAISSGRMTEPGLLRKAELIPTQRENLIAEAVADVVDPKKSTVRNIELIHRKISQINNGVFNMLSDRKTPFNMKQLRSRLMGASEESKLIFASDATAEKTYQAVVDEFMKHVKKGDTLALFKARQSFDKVPAIRKLLETERLGENVRRQIVLDIRRAANEFIAEQLPANNPYRSMLQKESLMFEGLGNIASTNAGNLGLNNIQILAKKYPVLKWVIGGTAAGITGAAGVGVGGAIIGSLE